ncbi:MAG: hypothetical protein ACOCRX_11115, partial [Candidatus Woesearchaeota archaeon]
VKKDPKTILNVSIGELYEFAQRVSKLIVNRKNKYEINPDWFTESEIEEFKKNNLYKKVWNKAVQERDLYWSNIFQEHAKKLNNEIVKENNKLKKKVENVDNTIEKAKEKEINRFVLKIYMDSLDGGNRTTNYYKYLCEKGYLKKSTNAYNRGEIDDEKTDYENDAI